MLGPELLTVGIHCHGFHAPLIRPLDGVPPTAVDGLARLHINEDGSLVFGAHLLYAGDGGVRSFGVVGYRTGLVQIHPMIRIIGLTSQSVSPLSTEPPDARHDSETR